MSSHCQYFGRGSIMSVQLREMERAARAANPQHFLPQKAVETSMDGDGRVTSTEVSRYKAKPMPGAVRHALAMERKRI